MNEKEICDLYSDPSRSLESVAKQAKTSVYLVRRCLDKNGVEIRPSGRPRVGITDPKALVHLGVKITKSDRDALETGAGKSANVREAIGLWRDRDKAVLSFTKQEVEQILAEVGAWPAKQLKQKMYDFLGKRL